MDSKIKYLEKIIVVGTTTQNNKLVNGQSMMFQLFVDTLHEKNIKTLIVDFGRSLDKDFGDRRVSGQFNLIKLLDNVILAFKYFFVLLINPKIAIYINTSQSRIGFVRDYTFINLGKLFNRVIIAHQFGANYHNFFISQSQFLQKRIKETLDKVDFVIVEGDYTKKQFSFLSDFENKVVSIPNGLPQKLDEAEIKPKNIKEPVVLFYLSNLIESKGYWDVLEAANILQNTYHKNIRLIFAGKFLEDLEDEICKNSGDSRLRFYKKLKEYNLTDVTTYHEGLYGKKKAENFKLANFFLLPSYYINEGQPVSVIEALAYGCVPIVTEYRLIPSMVNIENGYFVKPKSPVQIADAILACISDPETYRLKSENAISFYHKNFTADKYVTRILKLYDQEI